MPNLLIKQILVHLFITHQTVVTFIYPALCLVLWISSLIITIIIIIIVGINFDTKRSDWRSTLRKKGVLVSGIIIE